MLNFTRQERYVVYFLVVTLGIGAILKLVRNQRLEQGLHPDRFYKEEQDFKEIAEKINSASASLIESPDSSSGIDSSSESYANPTLINLNTADEDALSGLPGIGPAIAKRIRAYTDANGPFKNKEDIVLVKGIGNKLYTRIEGLVTTE